MVSISWWSVSWSEIPEDYANGILLGYRLTYYLAFRSGLESGGERINSEHEFDIFTFYYKATKLLNYAVYNIRITSFTKPGNGPVVEYSASKFIICQKDTFKMV